MSLLHPLVATRNSFSARIFFQFTLLVTIIAFSFTAFFIHYQSRTLKETLLKDAELLVNLLASSVRVGVFSESAEHLKDPVEGTFQKKEVLAVAIWTLDGKLLHRKKRIGADLPEISPEEEQKRVSEKVNKIGEPGSFSRETEDLLEIWTPVVSFPGFKTTESLYFPEEKRKTTREEMHILGFVEITLTKTDLKNKLTQLLMRNLAIVAIFLLAGLFAAYLLSKHITKPLNRLTSGVKAFGETGKIQEVDVESADEIGRLSMAFNALAESLKKRESEKALLEERLRHSQKMEAIGTLSGGIAHDFNNILQTIILNGKILQSRMGGDLSSRYFVDEILDSSQKASLLTKNLLAFSRKLILDLKPVDLNETLRGMQNLLANLLGVTVGIQYRLASEPVRTLADPLQLERVFMNLATNARDAMPWGGTFIIATEYTVLCHETFATHEEARPPRYAVVAIQDTGSGIDPKIQKNIFDPFFTTKEVEKGTGLGLSMVYGIIQQHGGHIEVQSELGRGTTFRLFLPATDVEIPPPSPPRPAKKARHGSGTLLLAEDNLRIRALFKSILEENGYVVLVAGDGEEAVRVFRENQDAIHLLLFDVRLPKKTGVEAFEEIKRHRPDTKVLFLSAYGVEELQQRKIVHEGVSVLSKPIPPDELLEKIRTILDG